MSSRSESSHTESTRTELVTEALLRDWPLPAAGDSKYSRGNVLVVGGAPRSPGAAILAGTAALRVGAGRLTLAVADSVAPHVAVAMPECAVIPLQESNGTIAADSLVGARDDLAGADAVLLGPGLDDAEQSERMVRLLPELVSDGATVVLDAFALGVLPRVTPDALRGRLVLTF